MKVRQALISVSDKTGIIEFAKGLQDLGISILSTGGTAKVLKEAGISINEVSGYTGFPEMLNGRVKTLHPKIHAGLLALRASPEHMRQLKAHHIGTIDMVVVNLYPFQKTIQKKGATEQEAIENIDIGGPSMLRSAAKNYRDVAVICNPRRYSQILEELGENACSLKKSTLASLAQEAFKLTSEYDEAIFNYFKNQHPTSNIQHPRFSEELTLELEKIQELRYGENPHQKAAFYRAKGVPYISFKQIQGKELSFNNLLDLDSAYRVVRDFKEPSAVVIKHTNPCGVASHASLYRAYYLAYMTDPLSSFGGIVALNRKVDVRTAKEIIKSGFRECIIAPSYTKEALKVFNAKKKLRLLVADFKVKLKGPNTRSLGFGYLLQDEDLACGLPRRDMKVVTNREPSPSEWKGLLFGWKVVKHLKSNAIVLTKGTRTTGVGAGQMSRVDSVIIAIRKADSLAKGSVLASDAFFPKEDAVSVAAKAGIKAIIQPGGSIADKEIIRLAEKVGISMVFTEMRHFRH